jgi:hypothetical protein
MPGFLETAVIAGIISAAAVYLAYRGWKTFRGKSPGCGSCKGPSCGQELLGIQPKK